MRKSKEFDTPIVIDNLAAYAKMNKYYYFNRRLSFMYKPCKNKILLRHSRKYWLNVNEAFQREEIKKKKLPLFNKNKEVEK